MTDLISSIPWNAPLFNKASKADLFYIIGKLSDASYHYADDSQKEWGQAALDKMQAAAKANELKLSYRALVALHSEQPQLVNLGDFIDAVLKDARK